MRYSADLFSRKRNQDALNTAPKNIVVEGPYKAYVGNLPWSVKPEDLRAHFSRFGTLVSARLLYDRKKGKNRVYGFISYSTPGELDSALSSNGEVQVSLSLFLLCVRVCIDCRSFFFVEHLLVNSGAPFHTYCWLSVVLQFMKIIACGA